MAVIAVEAEDVREAVDGGCDRRRREDFVGVAAGEFEMPTRTALADGQFLDMAVHHRPSGRPTFEDTEPGTHE